MRLRRELERAIHAEFQRLARNLIWIRKGKKAPAKRQEVGGCHEKRHREYRDPNFGRPIHVAERPGSDPTPTFDADCAAELSTSTADGTGEGLGCSFVT